MLDSVIVPSLENVFDHVETHLGLNKVNLKTLSADEQAVLLKALANIRVHRLHGWAAAIQLRYGIKDARTKVDAHRRLLAEELADDTNVLFVEGVSSADLLKFVARLASGGAAQEPESCVGFSTPAIARTTESEPVAPSVPTVID